MSQDNSGYPEEVVQLLRERNVSIGDRVRVIKGPIILEGIVMPRYSMDRKPILVIKLDNGYNVGIYVDKNLRLEKILKEKRREYYDEVASRLSREIMESRKSVKKSLRRVLVIGTGGTIASKVEYETGAVRPAMTAEEILEAIPEILDIAEIDAEVLFNILSENMTPRHWEQLAVRISDALKTGRYDGIIVAHGTDTMSYTASAIAFAVQQLPVPVVFVGSQRSSDRPSSDAAFNMLSAVIAATKLDAAESVVVMHGEMGDTYSLVHRGVRVRKMHTSRRDAFQSINALPLAKIYPRERKIINISPPLLRRGEREPIVRPRFEEKVALVKYYPGMKPDIFEHLLGDGYRGIVIEGTGLGHVGEHLIPVLKKAYREGVVVVMTSQCLFGRINMNVYNTGRKLLAEAHVIPGDDMLPETAFVKLSWLLANYGESVDVVRSMVAKNLVGELGERHISLHYPRWYHDKP